MTQVNEIPENKGKIVEIDGRKAGWAREAEGSRTVMRIAKQAIRKER